MSRETRRIAKLEKDVERLTTYSNAVAKRIHNAIMDKKAKIIIIGQMKNKIAKQTYLIEDLENKLEKLLNQNKDETTI